MNATDIEDLSFSKIGVTHFLLVRNVLVGAGIEDVKLADFGFVCFEKTNSSH
jgi:hypothetical protein